VFKYFAAEIVKQVHTYTYIYYVVENGKLSTFREQELQKHDTHVINYPSQWHCDGITRPLLSKYLTGKAGEEENGD